MSVRTYLLSALMVTSLVLLATPQPTAAQNTKFTPGNSVEEVTAKANQGDADAQEILAYYYTWGRGVPQDIGKAIEWYAKAAEQNNVIALQMLGFFANNGDYHDYAAKYFLRAAELGSKVGQIEMGKRYFLGNLGVPKNITEAEKWFHKAAAQGAVDGYDGLARVYYKKQNYAEAAKWFRMAAEKGEVSAQFNLGLLHYNGEGVLQDDREAAKWFQTAADQGHARSQYMIGVMHADGASVSKNFVEAHKWLNLAAATEGEHSKEAREYRDQVAKEMTKDQIAKAQKLARDWTAHKSTAN